jgi:hypothetical protein
VPEDFKGKLLFRLQADGGPFDIKVEDAVEEFE